ncbi:MAG: MMPL family transporter [Planctomycetaceae bacterium]
MKRLAQTLIRRRGWLLTGAVLVAIAAWLPASRLKFNQSIESLYAADNPRLLAFLQSKRWFGGDEFVILAYSDPQLLDEDGRLTDGARDRIHALADRLEQVPGIRAQSVQHLADAMKFPYARERVRKFVEGVLLGPDGQSTAVIARLDPVETAPIPRGDTFRQIRELAAAHDPPAYIVGEPIQVNDMFRYVEEDGATLGIASTGLLLFVILVMFRSLRWMALPLLVVQATLLWTKALLVVGHFQLSMVSSMLNSLVTIIGIATVMHVTVRFREKSATQDREAALTDTLRELIAPTFWTIVTTAAGFAALLSSYITPVASFGLMMTIATVLVYVAFLIIVPGGVLIGKATSRPSATPGEAQLSRWMDRLTDSVLHHPRRSSLVMAVLTIFCTAGLFRLHVETDFTKNFRESSPIVQSLGFFETKLGGAGTWEINFPAPAEFDEGFLDNVRGLVDDLRELEQRPTADRLTKVVALTDGLDLIPKSLFITRLSLEDRMRTLNWLQPEFVTSLYNSQVCTPEELKVNPQQPRGRMRIMLRALERQPSEAKLALIAEVERLAGQRFDDVQATGLFVLLTYLIESLMGDQLSSFLIAAAALVGLMIIANRSVPIGFIMLIPNLFPIVMVIGAMGWVGLPVNIATAMIASVSMGLTIDSSIHYLASYRQSRRQGKSFVEAVHATHQGVGMALVFANVALIAGFTVLTLSNFIPLVYFGVLVSVAMFGGLVGNLVMMPLLLRLVERPDAPTRESEPAPV